MTDQKYWIWYAENFTFQDLQARKAIEIFGSAKAVFELNEAQLPMLPQEFQRKIRNKDLSKAEHIIEECHKKHIRIVTYEDEGYPQRFRNIPDFPYVFYHFGKWYDFDSLPAIAMVGTRKCTPYGEAVSEGFSKELAKRGVLIISGLALGVDGHAHLGALKAKGDTVAVLGCGIDVIYPKANKDIFDLVYAHGAIISEYPPGEQVKNYYFPARNRLISALSLGVIVVEAGKNSGSLITANCALEQGKDVFAIPDSILSKNSEGSLELIQQGAKCVFRVEDILSEYEGLFSFESSAADEIDQSGQNDDIKKQQFLVSFSGLNETEQGVLNVLTFHPVHVDEVVGLSGLTVAQVVSSLTMLEIKGAVKSHPGRKYCLNIKE